MEKVLDSTAYSQLQTGTPIASYIKTILGKVDVRIINPWTGDIDEVILSGDPKKLDEGCIVDIWSIPHEAFFKKANKVHLEMGYVRKFERPVETPPTNPNDVSDDDILVYLDGKKTQYLKFKSILGGITSQAPLFRILDKAKELEKSEKMIKAIEARISEVQADEYKPT